MVFLCIASIVLSSIALHGIALHRIAWHCIAFDYLSWYCMVLHRLHGVVQLIWRAGELPRSASSHFISLMHCISEDITACCHMIFKTIFFWGFQKRLDIAPHATPRNPLPPPPSFLPGPHSITRR